MKRICKKCNHTIRRTERWKHVHTKFLWFFTRKHVEHHSCLHPCDGPVKTVKRLAGIESTSGVKTMEHLFLVPKWAKELLEKLRSEMPEPHQRLADEVPLQFPKMDTRNGLDEVSEECQKSVPIWTPAQELARID